MTSEEVLLGNCPTFCSTHKAEDILPINEIENRIERLYSQTFYHGNSYFPEQVSKSIEERQKDLERHIRLYGYPDFNYLLYGMDIKTPEEQDKYVNAWEFICRRNFLNMHRNIHNSTCVLRNKFYFGIFASAIGIKTPKNVAYIDNGVISDISDDFKETSLTKVLAKSPDVFCKSLDGENGVGVFHVEYNNDIITINGKQVVENEFWSLVDNGSFLIQEKIIQHPMMSRLYPTSINTLRIDTVRNLNTGKISVWPSIMRMGANGSHIDNGSQGGIMVNINLEEGKLDDYGYRFSKFGGGKVKEHPDTGVNFGTFKIPFFKETLEKCVFFHSMLKDIHSIGWDVVITPEGPAFIEGNDDWEIVDAQLGGGVRELFIRDFFE